MPRLPGNHQTIKFVHLAMVYKQYSPLPVEGYSVLKLWLKVSICIFSYPVLIRYIPHEPMKQRFPSVFIDAEYCSDTQRSLRHRDGT